VNIAVNIERLVLDGIALTSGQRDRLQAALLEELARLLAANGLSPELAAGGASPSLQVGGIQLAHETRPEQLGHQIARSVYAGLGAGHAKESGTRAGEPGMKASK